jgi:hypothetical protein
MSYNVTCIKVQIAEFKAIKSNPLLEIAKLEVGD